MNQFSDNFEPHCYLRLRSFPELRFGEEDTGQKTCQNAEFSRELRIVCDVVDSNNVGLVNGKMKNIPKSMLKKFSGLVGTLNKRIPAIERGILFNEPTKLKAKQ